MRLGEIGRDEVRLGEVGRDWVRLGETAVQQSACVTSSDRTETDMENLTPGAPVRQLDWGETTAHMKKRPRPCIMSMTLGLGLGLR